MMRCRTTGAFGSMGSTHEHEHERVFGKRVIAYLGVGTGLVGSVQGDFGCSS